MSQNNSTAKSHDPYSYRNSLVLINKLGVRNSHELEMIETTLSSIRAADGVPQGDFSYDHLKSVHKHLYQDVYDWAGEERKTSLTKHGSKDSIYQPHQITPALNQTFKTLEEQDFLKGKGHDQFSVGIADMVGSIDKAQPFRGGNEQVMQEFADQVASEAGYAIDWAAIDRDDWIRASAANSVGDREVMRDLMRSVVSEKASSKEAAKLKSKRYTAEQVKTLYPKLGEAARNLELQEKVERSDEKKKSAAIAFLKQPKDKALSSHPALDKHYEAWEDTKAFAKKQFSSDPNKEKAFLGSMKRKLVYGIIGQSPERETSQSTKTANQEAER